MLNKCTISPMKNIDKTVIVNIRNTNNDRDYDSMSSSAVNAPAHLVYTGTVVEGMRVASVVHEARNVTGGIRRLQELCLHVHLVELHREDQSAAASAKSGVRGQGSGLRPAWIDSYLQSGTSPGYWLALCLWRRGRRHCWSFCHSAKDRRVSGGGGWGWGGAGKSCSFLTTVLGVLPQHCGPRRPEERPTCPSLEVRSPCRGRPSAAFGVSPDPTPSPELLRTHKVGKAMRRDHTRMRLRPGLAPAEPPAVCWRSEEEMSKKVGPTF